MIERKAILVTQFGNFEVSSSELAKSLKIGIRIAKILGLRPRQNVNEDNSNKPISLEKVHTLQVLSSRNTKFLF